MSRDSTGWFVGTGIFIGIVLILYYGGLGHYLSLESLQEKSHYLKYLVAQHHTGAVSVYIATLMLLVALSLPIIVPFALLGGYLFGAVQGGIYSSVAATLGGVGAFIVFRGVFVKVLKQKYGARFERFNERFVTYGLPYILILHYSLVVPFFVMNALAALSNISLAKYFLATLLGSIPPCFIFAFAGREFGHIDTLRDVFSINVILAMLLLIFLALVPMVIRWLRGPIDV